MNPFKAKIESQDATRKQKQFEIVVFSSKLLLATGLTPEELDTALENDVEWAVGNYTIYPITRAYNNWQPQLEVRPNTVGQDLPLTWHFVDKGTATEILPDVKT